MVLPPPEPPYYQFHVPPPSMVCYCGGQMSHVDLKSHRDKVWHLPKLERGAASSASLLLRPALKSSPLHEGNLGPLWALTSCVAWLGKTQVSPPAVKLQ